MVVGVRRSSQRDPGARLSSASLAILLALATPHCRTTRLQWRRGCFRSCAGPVCRYVYRQLSLTGSARAQSQKTRSAFSSQWLAGPLMCGLERPSCADRWSGGTASINRGEKRWSSATARPTEQADGGGQADGAGRRQRPTEQADGAGRRRRPTEQADGRTGMLHTAW